MVFHGDRNEIALELISLIYQAALDPHQWQPFVTHLKARTDGIEPIFYVADVRTAMMESLLVSDEWRDTLLAPYMEYYNSINPWTPNLVRRAPVGHAVTGDELIPEAELKETEFYNDFFRRHGDWTGVVGVMNYRDPAAFSVLGLHFSRATQERYGSEIAEFSQQLSPHINRAFEISRHLGHGTARRATLELMLEALSTPALVVSADLRVRYANAAAEEIFALGVLNFDADGLITAAAASDTIRLRQSLLAASGGQPEARLVSFAFALDRDEPARSLPRIAHIMPCAGGMEALEFASGPMEPPREALAFITDPAIGITIPEQRLRELYGLTFAEARLAQALATGSSLQDYSASVGITVGTARTVLKSVFSKTSTNRQSQLVALLAQVARPLSFR